MGLVYILGALLVFIALGMLVHELRLRRLRRQRQAKGFDREKFMESFRQLGIPDNIPAAVYDYYASQRPWRDFPFSPDDTYSKVLHDDPWDIEDDQRALVERLGLLFLPEYIRRDWGDKPIGTLREMVIWLDWMRQRQLAIAKQTTLRKHSGKHGL